MTTVKLQVLDVGQGNSNFLEIYDDNNDPEKLTHTILMDHGSTDSVVSGRRPVRYVTDKLESMALPKINALFISHGDQDHHNLLWNVFENFDTPSQTNPTKPVLTIERSDYGGDIGQYSSADDEDNIINKIKTYMAAGHKPNPLEAGFSSFKMPGRPAFVQVATVQVRVIKGNLPGETGLKGTSGNKRTNSDAFAKNTVSLVLLVSVNNVQFVITGDATGVTMAKCNEEITNAIRPLFLSNVLVVTAPHHGSSDTGFNIQNLDKITPIGNLETFVDKIRAKCVVASAGLESSYKVPAYRLLQFFQARLDPVAKYQDSELGDRHFFTAYFEPNRGHDSTIKIPNASGKLQNLREGYWTFYTESNTYTNIYCMGNRTRGPKAYIVPPADATAVGALAEYKRKPLSVSWIFDVAANGSSTLTPRRSRPAPAAWAESLLTRLAPPPRQPVRAAAGPDRLSRLRVFP
jgi:beta-lactamase superfamily II metal-dependent hydrolase